MSPKTSLIFASVLFSLLWTASMFWWTTPTLGAPAVILMTCGALAGIGWYWGMSLWMRWSRRPNG